VECGPDPLGCGVLGWVFHHQGDVDLPRFGVLIEFGQQVPDDLSRLSGSTTFARTDYWQSQERGGPLIPRSSQRFRSDGEKLPGRFDKFVWRSIRSADGADNPWSGPEWL
jgi:hypothetical protein